MISFLIILLSSLIYIQTVSFVHDFNIIQDSAFKKKKKKVDVVGELHLNGHSQRHGCT